MVLKEGGGKERRKMGEDRWKGREGGGGKEGFFLNQGNLTVFKKKEVVQL